MDYFFLFWIITFTIDIWIVHIYGLFVLLLDDICIPYLKLDYHILRCFIKDYLLCFRDLTALNKQLLKL